MAFLYQEKKISIGANLKEDELGHNVHLEGEMADTLRSQTISTKLQGIAGLQGSKVRRQRFTETLATEQPYKGVRLVLIWGEVLG